MDYYDEGAWAHLQNYIAKFLVQNAASQYGASGTINAENLTKGLRERFLVFHPDTYDQRIDNLTDKVYNLEAELKDMTAKVKLLADIYQLERDGKDFNDRLDAIIAEKESLDQRGVEVTERGSVYADNIDDFLKLFA